MQFGVLYEIQVPRPWHERSQHEGFWQAIEQIRVAEEAGFEYVWAVEHHFCDEFALSSAPEVWLAAAAQHTSRIRIGHGVVLLPFRYNHPIRVAERAATLDIVSNGRLEFGTGRSITLMEMEGFGIDPSVTRAQWDEALHMIPRMWMDDEFSWNSELISVPPRRVGPKPMQRPHPPLWMAGTQPESVRIAAARGLGFMHFSILDQEGLAEKVAFYREAIKSAEPVGAFVNNRFATLTLLFCGEDDLDAFERGGAGVEYYANGSEGLYGATPRDGTEQSYKWYAELAAVRAKKTHRAPELSANSTACIGGPATCRAAVDWYEAQGVDQLLLHVQSGTTRHEDILDSLRRFGREVIQPRQAHATPVA
jgi:alkanesulfonate monooxygenase SsuD/methylene tetrahydromethanopterin reductase-like flavin-dependent oxidoreductase (luciferase family)